MRVQYSLPVTAPIVAMDRWRNILTRLLKLDFNVPKKLQGPISSVKELKNRRFYSTPLPGQIFSSSRYVQLFSNSFLNPAGSFSVTLSGSTDPAPCNFLTNLEPLHLKILLFRCCLGEPRGTMQIHTLNYATDVGLSNL